MELQFDIQLLRTVLVIAQTGSISAAAEALEVSQSAVSKQLQRIEEQLGVKLFERRARGVVPTTFGQSLIERGELIARQFKDAVGEIRALAGGEAGEIVIGAGSTWLHGPLPRAIERLVRKRPGLHIRILTDPTEKLLEELRAGRIDLVLAPWMEEVDRTEIEWTPVLVDDLRIMARKEHPLVRRPPSGLLELKQYGWVLADPGNPARRRLAAVFQNDGLQPPEPVIETLSFSLLLHLIRKTDFLTVLPALRFPWVSRGLAIVDSPHLAWRRSSGMFRRRNAAPTPAAALLVGELLRVVRVYYGPARAQRETVDGQVSAPLAALEQPGPAA
jgi:DNA-binding transcriptional LysR family regulator